MSPSGVLPPQVSWGVLFLFGPGPFSRGGGRYFLLPRGGFLGGVRIFCGLLLWGITQVKVFAPRLITLELWRLSRGTPLERGRIKPGFMARQHLGRLLLVHGNLMDGKKTTRLRKISGRLREKKGNVLGKRGRGSETERRLY